MKPPFTLRAVTRYGPVLRTDTCRLRVRDAKSKKSISPVADAPATLALSTFGTATDTVTAPIDSNGAVAPSPSHQYRTVNRTQ